VAAELSRDPVMIQEIIDGVDIHEAVRSDPQLFNGLVERVWAKVFNFRMIYADERTAAYAYYMDPNMPKLSKKNWERITKAFLEKYSVFAQWHYKIYAETVKGGGILIMPSGRGYEFQQYVSRRGERDYKRAQIYNYPVQGCAGGEILPIAKVRIRRALLDSPIKIVNTVHDSLIFDLPTKKDLDILAELWYNTLRELPTEYEKSFGVKWIVPLDGDMKAGPSWGELKKI
jgi:DNA polymerase I-like protein with 3'-5' exonuclease and polymerase domains